MVTLGGIFMKAKHASRNKRSFRRQIGRLLILTVATGAVGLSAYFSYYYILKDTFFAADTSSTTATSSESLTSPDPTKEKLGFDTHYANFQQRVDASNSPSPLAAQIDEYLKAGDFIGTALVVHEGKIIYQKGAGYANLAKGVVNDINTQYNIGSVQKNLTGLLIMQQIQQGKLSLDTSLATFYPTIPYAESITIRQMLTMHSGLVQTKQPTKVMDDQQLIQFACDHLKVEKLGQWRYSPVNFVLLSGILMQLTGNDYYQLVQQQILDPLVLAHSAFYQTFTKDKAYPVAYAPSDAGADYGSIVKEADYAYARELGTGNLAMTPGDLYTYYQALLSGKLLTAQQVTSLLTPYDQYTYAAGLYNRGTYYTAHGVEKGMEVSAIVATDASDAVILMTNQAPGHDLNSDQAAAIYQMITGVQAKV